MPPLKKTNNNEVDEVRVELRILGEKVMEMSGSVVRIENALLGDEFNKNGIVNKLESIDVRFKHFDERIVKLEKTIERYQYAGYGAGGIITILAGIIMYLLKFKSLI